MNVFGVIGNPIGHSLSPPMHEAAYDACDIDARYVTFEPERSSLERAIDGADALGISGLNVTVPFKQDVLEHVEQDPLAARIGAVNTIDFTGEHPIGYNTDAGGACTALRTHDVTLEGAAAVVVGAGGAGRAIAFGLADAGANVAIANRTTDRAVQLAEELSVASGHGLDSLPRLLDTAQILVNATSVGMESDETPVPPNALHEDLTVMDAVYRPLETRLLRDARAVGADPIDGAWMLLYQGVEAFEHWFDIGAPVDAMNNALRTWLDA